MSADDRHQDVTFIWLGHLIPPPDSARWRSARQSGGVHSFGKDWKRKSPDFSGLFRERPVPTCKSLTKNFK